MELNAHYNVNSDDFALFVKLLPQKLMFLVDIRPDRDHKVVHRSYGEILFTLIRRHQPSPSKPDFKVFIVGANWGSLNGTLFEDVAALAYAIQKRGLQQVAF